MDTTEEAGTARDAGRAARWSRLAVLGLGAVYVVLAVAGFVRTGSGEFGMEEPVRLWGFLGVSTLANIVHGVVGLVALVAALRGGASGFAPPATIAFVAMAVFGTVARMFGGHGDPLNLTWWNVALYVLSAIVCVLVYTMRMRAARE